jgi:hypothetical protein
MTYIDKHKPSLIRSYNFYSKDGAVPSSESSKSFQLHGVSTRYHLAKILLHHRIRVVLSRGFGY